MTERFEVRPRAAWAPPPPRAELKWAAVDFDGTLTHSTWSPENPLATPGEPIRLAVLKLNELRMRGYKVIIHTSRPWSDYELIESWLNHHGIPFDRIVCGKLLAAVYVDDRAVHADESVWYPR